MSKSLVLAIIELAKEVLVAIGKIRHWPPLLSVIAIGLALAALAISMWFGLFPPPHPIFGKLEHEAMTDGKRFEGDRPGKYLERGPAATDLLVWAYMEPRDPQKPHPTATPCLTAEVISAEGHTDTRAKDAMNGTVNGVNGVNAACIVFIVERGCRWRVSHNSTDSDPILHVFTVPIISHSKRR